MFNIRRINVELKFYDLTGNIPQQKHASKIKFKASLPVRIINYRHKKADGINPIGQSFLTNY